MAALAWTWTGLPVPVPVLQQMYADTVHTYACMSQVCPAPALVAAEIT